MSQENEEIVRRTYEEGMIYRDPEGLVAWKGALFDLALAPRAKQLPARWMPALLLSWRGAWARACSPPASSVPRTVIEAAAPFRRRDGSFQLETDSGI